MTDVSIKRYLMSSAPRVGWHNDERATGSLLEQGPEQSLIKWDNGNENFMPNTWFKIMDGTVASISPVVAPPSIPAVAKPVVPKGPPDDLSERLKPYGVAELKAFAVANGVWDDKYDALPNPGLVRMNVVNRLRARLRKGHQTVWK